MRKLEHILKIFPVLYILAILNLACPVFAQGPFGMLFSGQENAGGGTETIGYESVGASNSTYTSADVVYLAALDTAVHSGTFQKIKIYSSNPDAAIDMYVGLYDGATPATATLVGRKYFENVGTWSAGWHEFDVSDQSWAATAGHSYWIGSQVSSGTKVVYYYDEPGGTQGYFQDIGTFGDDWPATWGASSTSTTRLRSKTVTIAY
jgi:hypothetical protein